MAHLAAAVRNLRDAAGIRVRRCSRVWESAPVGFRRQPWFLNAVARTSVRLPPRRLLQRLKAVERRLGRRPARRYGPRVIDLDLLLYGTRVIATPTLSVPHPGLPRRRFVLAPILEIAPRLRDPRTGMPLAALLRRAPGTARRVAPAGQRRFRRLARGTSGE
jgi:2-amino-4-hydroxy-6-hydroxymethyldihydropteridine diphosphokinase